MTINEDPASKAADEAASKEAAAADIAVAAAIAASDDAAGMFVHWIGGSKSLSHKGKVEWKSSVMTIKGMIAYAQSLYFVLASSIILVLSY